MHNSPRCEYTISGWCMGACPELLTAESLHFLWWRCLSPYGALRAYTVFLTGRASPRFLLGVYRDSSRHIRRRKIAKPTAIIHKLRSSQDFFSGSFLLLSFVSIFFWNKWFENKINYSRENEYWYHKARFLSVRATYSIRGIRYKELQLH